MLLLEYIKDYHGYSVTNCGRVIAPTGKELRPSTLPKGYKSLSISVQGKWKTGYIHRLVALLFVHNPQPELYTQVNHLDGNTANNRAENLEWIDARGNNLDMISRRKSQGLNVLGMLKINYDGREYESVSAMARMYGVTHQLISQALKRGIWRGRTLNRAS